MNTFMLIFCDTFYDFCRMEFTNQTEMEKRVKKLTRTGQTVVFAGPKE